jgi:hypothetical protein
MSRIMILGMSPLPFENDKKVYGTGIRTWQLASPLLEDGHHVCLVTYAIRSAYPAGFASRKEAPSGHKGKDFEYFAWPKRISRTSQG